VFPGGILVLMAISAQTANYIPATWSRGWHHGCGGSFCAVACCAAFIALATGSSCCRAQSVPVASNSPSTASSGTHADPATQLHNPSMPKTEVDPQRQKIVSECADLLKLATDLKEQVDKSTKDQLSAAVVHKADEIEQLARKLKNGNREP
jgi:hypothetical protein